MVKNGKLTRTTDGTSSVVNGKKVLVAKKPGYVNPADFPPEHPIHRPAPFA